MTPVKIRAHELIAQAIFDAGVSPDGDLVVEMGYGLYGEFMREADVLKFWNHHGIHPEVEQSEVLREYRDRFFGVSPRVVCRTDLLGDEVVVMDLNEHPERR
jgi:hypothetical protein